MLRKGLYILVLLISSIVFSSNDAMACCNKGDQNASSCQAEEAQETDHTSSCCSQKANSNEDEPLTPCGNCDCNCVQTISYINSEFRMELNMISITSYFTYGWHYNQPLPEKLLNSIWQPPQLS
jgi:hypothetical protein